MITEEQEKKLSASPEMIRFIEAKRTGKEHRAEDIIWFINNLDYIPDYQVSAWLMAVCLNGLSENETKELTRCMAYSGHVLTLKRSAPAHHHDHDHDHDCPSIHVAGSRGFVDKHSTGGVGDKVTLALTPILAALGFNVSKFSGRSLGHTGGTIDKLEAIPGFKTDITMKQFEKQIDKVGIALASQSLEFAPADKRLYSLRDRTGTVDSIPLIASSVMSKKIAGGADIILLDVKVGSGAFMKDLPYAKKLAKQMVAIGSALNLNTKALITNMDQPLGAAVGNGLELIEAMELLEAKVQNDLYDLVFEFASLIANPIEVKDAIRSGKAYVKFEEWITAQGGDLTKVREANQARYKLDCKANKDAWVKKLDARIVGEAIHELGYKPGPGGLYNIDNSAGVTLRAKVGSQVKPSDLLFTVQGNNEAELETAMNKILSAYEFSESKTKAPKLILRKYSV
jgi:pyrimidine-nucleoside phosphorylase